MDAHWIDSTDGLAAWIAGCDGGPLALDTEADSFHHYREKVCLVQLSCGDRHALVDPLAPVDLQPLVPPCESPTIRKLLHGADYDVRLLYRDFGITLSGLTDTMISARLLGEPALGLAALLTKHLGVTLDKSHQRADWSKRPLTAPMRAYAIADTAHLAALATILDEQLQALGRTAWAAEECRRLENVRWRDRAAGDPEPFRRVKGARGLNRRALAVLSALWTWRDGVARKRDRPPFKVMRDETLVALAKAPPPAIADLAKVSGVPESLVRSPSAHELLEAVRSGLAVPDDALPEMRVDIRVPLAPEVEARIARIKERRDLVAKNLALDPSILASRGTVEDMAKLWEAGSDPWSAPELREWQAGLLRPMLG